VDGGTHCRFERSKRMRKIKFRAWDEESQKIYYVVTLDTESVYGKCEVPILRVITGKMLDEYQPEYKTVYDYTLMQYTGLKDKNGVEIYEGDIVENTTQTVYLGDKYEVVWNKNYAGYQLMSNGFTSNIPLIQNFMSYKVIGNIFENPELIQQQDQEEARHD
jgi:uncharacterized phage protein (TIGR01671 family)